MTQRLAKAPRIAQCGKERMTYRNSHARALHEAREQQQPADDLPSRRPSLHTTRYYNTKGDQRAELDDDVKRDEEADGPPHAAEVFVLGAHLLVREGCTGTVARAVAVEAHGLFVLVILAVVSRVLARALDEGRRHTEAHRGIIMLAIVIAVPARLSRCHLRNMSLTNSQTTVSNSPQAYTTLRVILTDSVD